MKGRLIIIAVTFILSSLVMLHFSIPVKGLEPPEHPEDHVPHVHQPQSMPGSDEPLAPEPQPFNDSSISDNSTNNTRGH
jgi:hypothetical protein